MCLDLSRGQTKSFRKTPFDPIVLTFFCTEFIVSNENFCACNNKNYCMFDFEIKGISEVINRIVHDESLPAKPEW